MKVQGQEVENIIINGEIIQTNYDESSKTITLQTHLLPEVIDANFRELETRINQLENTIRNMNISINKLENKINILNAVVNK